MHLFKHKRGRNIQIKAIDRVRSYTSKETNIIQYLKKAREKILGFKEIFVVQVLREENFITDTLANLASAVETGERRTTTIEVIDQLAYKNTCEVMEVNTQPNQMTPIIEYIQNGSELRDKVEAQYLRRKAAKHCLFGGLQKRFFTYPYLKCVTPEEGDYVLRELYKGICGNHSGLKALARKAL